MRSTTPWRSTKPKSSVAKACVIVCTRMRVYSCGSHLAPIDLVPSEDEVRRKCKICWSCRSPSSDSSPLPACQARGLLRLEGAFGTAGAASRVVVLVVVPVGKHGIEEAILDRV